MTTTELKKEKQKTAELSRLISAEIEYYLKWEGYTKEQLATKLGMSLASLYNKVKNVDKFTYKELRRLCNVLKLSDETKLALIA